LAAVLIELGVLPAAWRSGRPELAAHAAYWALAEILLAAAFVLSALPSEFGPPAARYLVPFFYAAVATTPVWASGPSRRQAAVGAAAAAFCLASAFQLAQTDFGGDAGREQLIDSLRQRGLTRGYASYWTAAPVAWNTGLGLRVAPVTEDPARPDEQCGEPICPFAYNSLSAWYRPQPGMRTFVVTHPNVDYMRRPPPASLGPPLEVFQAGGYTVYVFADDVAARRLGGPVLDRPHADNLRAQGLLAPAGFALLTAGAQDNPGTRQLAFRLGVDPGVNSLVRYGHPGFSPMALIAQSARYLLR